VSLIALTNDLRVSRCGLALILDDQEADTPVAVGFTPWLTASLQR
jgi:hypothetical protein